jgi:alanine dehydrogenase
MEIGIPKEIKNHEYRVGLLPASVRELTQRGHRVLVETSAGVGAGFADADYIQAGAVILDSPEAVFDAAELVVKVKEPQSAERALLTARHTLLTYLHLAPDRAQTEDLLASQACCIAYETVTDHNNRLPLLAPMSEVPVGCRFRPVRCALNAPMAVKEFCSAACRVSSGQTLSS